ncbi:MAG TPA: M1 family metallopeptidase [Chloroflexia bacterium]|nr:M1 family metallopeptidase [Chloroflexia bacterium]
MKLTKRARLTIAMSLLLLVACDNAPGPVTPTVVTTSTLPTTLATLMPTTTSVAAKSPTSAPATSVPTQQLTPTIQPPTPGSSAESCVSETAQAEQDGLGDPLFPQLGNSGYDALHYTLDLLVGVESNLVFGTTTMRARSIKDMSAFNLDFESLEITTLTVNGTAARYSHERHELTITPATSLKAGEIFTVTVDYRGEPNSDPGDNSPNEKEYALGWSHYDGGIFVASEPSGAASFYPVNDHPCDKATYTFRITVPERYVVAANGTLKGITENGQTNTYLFETRDPMASYLAAINIAEFDRETQQGPGGLPIRNYFEKSLDSSTREEFERTPEMIEYFSQIYGPYPFDVYGAVVLDDNLGFALETQTLSLFGRRVGNDRVDAEQVIAHELSHQWFGDSVSLTSWRDIWLNEGFASMSEWLWIEHSQGEGAYESYVRGVYGYAQENFLSPPADPSADDLFNAGVYLRGGLTLYALRKEVGDDLFFRTLQTYTSRYRNGNARTEDFIEVAEEVSGKELGDLFNAWLHHAEMPPLP